ncbi:MAG TPA: hypothetical protein VMZ91_00785 [Candidatus Paceibacterota bacterium]|nr:hypothetical protein [Candidatus Paceibacterota bacterium]
MQENNQEQEKTVDQEIEEEINERKLDDEPKEQSIEETKENFEDEYLDLTNEEVIEEKKFQEAVNTAEVLDKQDIPQETSNVIKDQDLIFLQYQCEDENCKFKFYINNLEEDIGEKLKCFKCGKKLMKKKRLFDVTIKQFKNYLE